MACMVNCGVSGAILGFSLSACRVIPRTWSDRVAHSSFVGFPFPSVYSAPEWRNWQTRRTQNAVSKGVWVRVPPRARHSPSSEGVFCFNVLTKLAIASPDGLGRGLWLGRRGPIQVCGCRVQDPGWWALRLLRAGSMRFLLPVPSGGPGAGLHLFMCRGREQHDSGRSILRHSGKHFATSVPSPVPLFVRP